MSARITSRSDRRLRRPTIGESGIDEDGWCWGAHQRRPLWYRTRMGFGGILTGYREAQRGARKYRRRRARSQGWRPGR